MKPKSRPTVSVVMPVYNSAPTVALAIESVLSQTRRDLELIVVDDASTDETPAIVEWYAREDPRTRITRNLANSRAGVIEWEPRNDGLKLVAGSLIAYLDADNVWRPRFVETLAGRLEECDELQLVHCDSRNFHDATLLDDVIARDARTPTARGEDWVEYTHGLLEPLELGTTQYIDANEIMHRAGVFRRLGWLWSTTHSRRDAIGASQGVRCPWRRHNDLDLVERIIAAFGARAVARVPQVLVDYYYRSAFRDLHHLGNTR